MKRRILKVIAILTMLVYSVSVKGITANATGYAYSIGVDHGNTLINWINGDLSGDFTENVKYAATCYGLLKSVKSYYNLKPNVEYMKGNNPNGERRIASKIVFLNGHGNYDNMVFPHNNENKYKTGIYMGYDFKSKSTGFDYVGIKSTDMSTCKLISFVGCKTAANRSGENLVKNAIKKGAKSAVGFMDEIESRSDEGKKWLKKYNNSLCNGKSVSDSVKAAISAYPNCTLSKSVVYSGIPSQTIGTKKVTAKKTGVDVSTINNVIDIAAEDLDNKEVIEAVKKYDAFFEPKDYIVTVNIYDQDNKTGVIIFSYVINNEIQTNKSYICYVENGIIDKIGETQKDEQTYDKFVFEITDNMLSNYNGTLKMENSNIKIEDKEIDENALNNLVEQHKKSASTLRKKTKPCNVESSSIRYYYDYFTGKLVYEKTYYVKKDGVIVDDYNCETLK